MMSEESQPIVEITGMEIMSSQLDRLDVEDDSSATSSSCTSASFGNDSLQFVMKKGSMNVQENDDQSFSQDSIKLNKISRGRRKQTGQENEKDIIPIFTTLTTPWYTTKTTAKGNDTTLATSFAAPDLSSLQPVRISNSAA